MKTDQIPLFNDQGEAYARNTDPATSHIAAGHVRGDEASRMEHTVLVLLEEHPGGLTNHEIVQLSGIPWNTATPRIRPLIRKGLVFDSRERRPGPSGRPCSVWKSTTPKKI